MSPRFVERGGEQSVPGPYLQEQTRLRAFVVRGDEERLARLLERDLVEPSGGEVRCRPLSSSLLVSVAEIGRLTSSDPEARRLGVMREIDLTFWIPVLLEHGGESQPAWYIPYLFVDSGPAVATGREVYGFHKAQARFELPAALDGTPLVARAPATLRRDPEAPIEEQLLVEIARAGGEAPSRLAQLRAIAPLLGGDGATTTSALRALTTLAGRSVPIVFLRQLRDVADPRRAAFQEIVVAAARPLALREGGFLDGSWELRLPPRDSHPIAADLGLRAAGHPVLAAFWNDFDFSMELGRTIWRAGWGSGDDRRASLSPVTRLTPRASGSSTRKRRIAVLGGGLGALSTVFHLTSEPGWRDRYEITVYQMGFRVGGKGASGRNPDAGQRIEEHGLHIWFGFYDHAFRMMRRCLAEAGRTPGTPLATFEDNFRPHYDVTVTEEVGGEWIPWTLRFPPNDRQPGVGEDGPGLTELVRALAAWTAAAIRDALALPGASAPRRAASFVEQASLFGVTALLRLLQEVALPAGAEPRLPAGLSSSLLEEARRRIAERLEARLERDHELRRMWIGIDYGLTNLAGILRDRLLERGFDAINDLDYTEWLRRHGASELTLRSAPVRAGYDLVFGFADGDTARPDLAAGVALRGLLRMLFGYKGALMWKMQAGMGDVVFTPLYQVLSARGVRFAFFHKVRNLGLSEDGQRIERIEIGRQATVQGGAEYQPLVEIKGIHCWPDRPHHDQLVEGEALRDQRIDLESSWSPWPDVETITLRDGADFDEVVLGIPPAALCHVARELVERKPAWRDMVTHVTTVCTHAAQLWMRPDLAGLGWPDRRPLDDGPVLGGFVEPTDTWADMSHLIPVEDWPTAGGGDTPGHIAYLCGPLREPARSTAMEIPSPGDPAFPAAERAAVMARVAAHLDANARRLWPAAVDEHGRFRRDLLVAPAGATTGPNTGEDRYAAQLFKANVEPTDRYSQSRAGSIRYRLRADGSGVDNLFLCGDWIDNGFNAGCVEATVLSGEQCAEAVRASEARAVSRRAASRAPAARSDRSRSARGSR